VTETRVTSDAVCRIHDVVLTDASGAAVTTVSPNEPLELTATYAAAQDVPDITFGFYMYRSTDQLMVYDGNIHGREVGINQLQAGREVTMQYGTPRC
jgi:hypothetical protein